MQNVPFHHRLTLDKKDQSIFISVRNESYKSSVIRVFIAVNEYNVYRLFIIFYNKYGNNRWGLKLQEY